MKKFPALHTISAILKILAVVIAIAAIAAFIAIIAKALPLSGQNPTLIEAAILIGGAFYFLMIWAMAEGILVILAIEENTRKAHKES
jgi:hypothetical protein